MNPDFSLYPICDTDIWVNLCLGDLLPRLFRKYQKLIIADVVEGEILAWGNGGHFTFIAEEFKQHKNCGNIFVLEHEVHINPEDRTVLEQVLFDLGFKYDFKNNPRETNKGEFVSAIYADHFQIPFMKTNDNAFQESGNGAKEFPDLIIKNWYEVIEELVSDPRERIAIRKKVDAENKRMVHHNHKYKEERGKEVMLQKLSSLAGKFNNKRL
ncbi:hypothetical protein [Paenibacillus silvae]|uniref:hypothetical protein n=1 Tax=Paenibacillus silvae TaxID=1325358 RepID=UPI002004C97A|nr:hypothetical protein [Paenibacillus silvae]MCK6075378.1 hypothetical protein [Paenibacillus silvae]MCK6149765.1 hypothetical protein [Paenibacillus silvae]MCK6268063.1 hypothetical protein [Paenibacillus silvae]